MSAKPKTQNFDSARPFVMPRMETPRCAISEDGKIIFANPAFYELIEREQNEMYDIFDIFDFGEDALPENRDISYLTAGEYNIHLHGDPVVTEFRFDWVSATDGTRTLIASAIDPLAPDEAYSEEIEQLLAAIHTKTKIAPQHQDIGEQDFLNFVDMTHDVMVITDESGIILAANPTFNRNFTDKEHNLIGTSFINLFAGDDRHMVRNTMQTLLREALEDNTNTANFELPMRTQTGKTRWVEWRQKSQNNKIYASGRDITDIRQKHADLLRRQRQLSEAEAIGRMGHWHWIIGQDNLSWSEEIYRIFGVDADHFQPSLNKLTDMIHKRDIGRVVQAFQRAIIEENNYNMEFRVIRPGGEPRYIQCEGRCEKDDSGEVIALYGIMQDITERILYEEELKKAKNASEQANIAKSQFLANMSHELRTPLNAIIGFSEMMENQMLGPIFNEKYLEYATGIRQSGQHLLDLISDILDMSKIEAGKYVLDLERTSLQETLARANNMIEARAAEKGVRVCMPSAETPDVMLKADRRGLLQVFLNVLSNAVKFTPEGGKVWIEYETRDSSLLLKVCDNGVGIPPNKLAAVTRPFEQAGTSYTRDHEGTGLGLSITKELVALHGGTLHIDSKVEIGTTVSIRLPYASTEIA